MHTETPLYHWNEASLVVINNLFICFKSGLQVYCKKKCAGSIGVDGLLFLSYGAIQEALVLVLKGLHHLGLHILKIGMF